MHEHPVAEPDDYDWNDERQADSRTVKPFPNNAIPLAARWQRARLDDVTERASGHTPDQSRPEYWNGGIKWVSLADSHRLDRGYIRDTSKEISALGIRHSSAVLLPAQTVIVSRDAGVGKSAVLQQEMAVSQHFIAWKCGGKDVLDPWFLYDWLHVNKPFFERIAVGSTIKTIGLPIFRRLTIDFPPIAEQRKIAEILRTWDHAIEKLTALRTAQQRKVAGLSQKLLGRSGDFPAHWSRKRLSQIAPRVRRASDGGEHPVMTISAKSGFLMQSDKFARDMAGTSVERYLLLYRGEFAYNKGNSLMAPYGCIYALEEPSALVPFVYYAFALDSELNHEFYTHLFAAGALNHQLSRLINSGVRNDGLLNLDADDFFSCQVPVPPLEEQRRIGATLTSAKRELQLLEKEVQAFSRQKRGLMQKLLTGEWPVPTPDREAVRT
ncbi:MAG: restriction endonuclease subunit S [Rhodospirillales bacterium]|nr:restriction endonuclease subunit S [Rhodospirillales bacterium]